MPIVQAEAEETGQYSRSEPGQLPSERYSLQVSQFRILSTRYSSHLLKYQVLTFDMLGYIKCQKLPASVALRSVRIKEPCKCLEPGKTIKNKKVQIGVFKKMEVRDLDFTFLSAGKI
jgi:hypothetical protein